MPQMPGLLQHSWPLTPCPAPTHASGVPQANEFKFTAWREGRGSDVHGHSRASMGGACNIALLQDAGHLPGAGGQAGRRAGRQAGGQAGRLTFVACAHAGGGVAIRCPGATDLVGSACPSGSRAALSAKNALAKAHTLIVALRNELVCKERWGAAQGSWRLQTRVARSPVQRNAPTQTLSAHNAQPCWPGTEPSSTSWLAGATWHLHPHKHRVPTHAPGLASSPGSHSQLPPALHLRLVPHSWSWSQHRPPKPTWPLPMHWPSHSAEVPGRQRRRSRWVRHDDVALREGCTAGVHTWAPELDCISRTRFPSRLHAKTPCQPASSLAQVHCSVVLQTGAPVPQMAGLSQHFWPSRPWPKPTHRPSHSA